MDLIERILRTTTQPDFGPERVRDVVAAVLADPTDWLDPRHQHRGGEDWMMHSLYRAASLSVLAVVFGPGIVCPAHDHGSWAVVGVYRGRERETRYRRANPPRGLVVDRVLVSPRGTTVVVPSGTIHTVEALDGHDAVSIHVYGTDIVTQHRHEYDPATGAAKIFAPDIHGDA
ncbi:cysteine dioxygenase family protein [Nocardioides insulae]|uniref:cysteine dioxygenase family protein n=1 Tax=Nocardioides insulae TaxID=394734 RepID=UPI00042A2ACD|nr:cysteine dioxygenase family protein [Nocardioides insulae]